MLSNEKNLNFFSTGLSRNYPQREKMNFCIKLRGVCRPLRRKTRQNRGGENV